MKRLAVLTIFMTIILMIPGWALAETAGSFTFVRGRVDITSPGEKARPVEEGDVVNVGDIVRTKTGAKAEITFKDGSIIRLAQRSRMKINEYMVKKNQRRSLLSLFRGKLQGIVKKFAGFVFGRKRRNRFEVHTPTAVSGVRGTNFFTWFINGVSGSAVKEGNVYVYPKNSPTFVQNITVGQAAVIKNAGAPPVVKPATDVEIQEHIKDTAPEKEEAKAAKDKAEKAVAPLAETVEEGQAEGAGEAVKEAVKEKIKETGPEGSAKTTVEAVPELGMDTVANITFMDTGIEGGMEETLGALTQPIENVGEVDILKYEEPIPDLSTSTSTFFAGDLNLSFLDTGSISGYIENDQLYPAVYSGQGGLSLVGSYSGAGPGQAAVGTVNGVMDDQTAFNGNLGGVQGSWNGLFNSIYVSGGTIVSDEGTVPVYTLNNASVGYLYGALSGTFGDGNISASGTSYRSDILGQVDSITLGTFPEGQPSLEVLASSLASQAFNTETTALPDLSSIVVGNAVDNSGVDNQGYISTIAAAKETGVRKLGIWMDPSSQKSYQNTTGSGTWQAIYGQHDGSSGSYYMLGAINGTDDRAGQLANGEVGHVSVTGSLGYLDNSYYGDITLWNKGTYDLSGSYDSLTAGTFTRYPLAYSGTWGNGVTCLYTHENGDMIWAGSDLGIIGGRTSPWDNRTSELIVYGQYDVDPNNGGAGYHDTYLFDTGINIDDGSGQIIDGYGAGIWKITSTNNDQTTFGKAYGSAVALYEDGSENMGFIASKDIAGIFYPDVNMFNALGTWVKDDPRLTGGYAGVGGGSFNSTGLAGQFTGGGSLYGGPYGGTTRYFILDNGTSSPWGIYEVKIGSGNYYYDKTGTWSAKLGGMAVFGTSTSDTGYWLADITNGTWTLDEHAEINAAMEGIYLTQTRKGNIGGPFYGINAGDGTGGSSWAGESIGIYESTEELDFGGATGGGLYFNDYNDSDNDDEFIDSSGEVTSTFGLTARDDGNYDLLTLGIYYDGGNGAEGFAGPYILSSSFSGDDIKGNGNLTSYNIEGFSAGIWKNTDPDNMAGEINSHVVAITLEDDGAAGLLSGDADGNFYEMNQGMYASAGMWKTSGILEKNVKITDQFVPISNSPNIYTNGFGAKLAGSFTGSSESSVSGASDDLNSMTEFIRYTLPGDIAASLPWGIHTLDLLGNDGFSSASYSGKPSGSTSWTAKTGGEGTFGFYEDTDSHGFWLADVNGTWHEDQPGAEHGYIDGTFSNGIYLSTTQMGSIDGWLYGLYSQDGVCEITGLGYGTWVAGSVGTYTGEPLAFSSVLSGDEFYSVPGTVYEGNYEILDTSGGTEMPESISNYDYQYFIDGNSSLLTYGDRWTDQSGSPGTGEIYLPAGEHITITGDHPLSFTTDSWAPGSLGAADFSTPPGGSGGWIKYDERSWSTHSIAKFESGETGAGAVKGILGGTTSLWNSGLSVMEPANITLLGTYTPHMSSAGSYDPLLFSMKIVESGVSQAAYSGYIGGIIDETAGNIHALYIDPDKNAGIMTGDFTGQAYPSINMWDAAGTIDFEQKVSVGGIAAADLGNNLDEGFIAGAMGSSDEQFLSRSMGWGKTLSLADYKDWGVFQAFYGHDNRFDPQAASSVWRAGGHGIFGASYPSGSSGPVPDSGYWMASAADMSLDSPGLNMLKAHFTGNFLTLTQYGDINADFIGSYDSANKNWMGTMGGYWDNGWNLLFNGVIDSEDNIQHIVEEWSGHWDDGNTGGSFYDYGYFPETGGGWSVEYDAFYGTTIHKDYRAPGPDGNGILIIMTDNGTNVTFNSGTWSATTSLYDEILINGPNQVNVPYDSTNYVLMTEDSLDGLLGGLSDLWPATDASRAGIKLMGEYDTDLAGSTALPDVYAMGIKSVNPYDNTISLENGGAYTGYLAGRILATNEIQGWIYALYIDPANNAGILRGSYGWITDDLSDGAVRPGIDMWSADGGIYPILMESNNTVDYQNLSIADRQFWSIGYGDFLNPSGTDIGDINYLNGNADFISLYDDQGYSRNWGVWYSVSGGPYNFTDSNDVSSIDHWMMHVDEGTTDQSENMIFNKSAVMDVTGSRWTSGRIDDGTVLGAWADLNEVMEPVTGVLSGELTGTFDPVKATWQTAAAGSWIETKKFLAMTAVDANGNPVDQSAITKLNQLNIPAVRIGKTTLSGTNNNINVTMQDVTFFAYSTGADPRIWATENVNGSYNTTPSLYETVPMTGNGLSAGFTIRNWDTNTDRWGAQVQGGGTFANTGSNLDGKTVNIDGVAAGIYDNTAKTFTGTGAGVSTKAPSPEP